MKFETPATTNPIDQLKVIGKPTNRIDGPLKTTGTAIYAYEQNTAAPNAAYGYVLGAAIAKGRIVSIDLSKASAAPGVLSIVTAENTPRIDRGQFYVDRALAGPDVDHYHQAVAVVVAESFEQARAASKLIHVDYVREVGKFSLAEGKDSAPAPDPGPYTGPSESTLGDFDGAFAAAPVKVDATYTTPDHAHAMMEPHATIAAWEGEKLTLWTSIQQVNWGVRDLAKTLGIRKENIRLISPYVGGGFGGKGTILCDAVLASLAARKVRRPVKLTLTRPLMFNNLTHRAATIQRIRIGATLDGKITAIGHEGWSGNIKGGTPESVTTQTRVLYAGPNRMTRQRLAHLDLAEGNAMRAPGETTGMMALEVAMDELAEKLGMDPIEFRVLNDTQVDPADPAKKFSQRHLVECLRTGAQRFGWDKRNAKPGMTRDGPWLIGIGVASAIRGAPTMKSAARVRLDSRGALTVETDMTDLGTGSYTIIAQTAAEMMGVTVDQVTVRLGDSTFPESPGSGGQWGAASSTAGVYAACMELREMVAGTLGYDPEKTEFSNGQVTCGGESVPLGKAAKRANMVATESMEFGALKKQYEQHAFGAHFAEVGVDAATGEIRIRRMLMTAAAGRILNPKAARSQLIGGMTMGAGAALMEEMAVDKKIGFFVNHDLAGYEVPVHADIPHQEVIFLDELDPTISPLKAKGVGELGISGVPAAVAFAREGASVIVADVLEQELQETVRLIEEPGGRALAVKCDVRRTEDIKTALDKGVQAFGRLDFAFNNAGVEQPVKPLTDVTDEEWDRTIEIDLRGVFLCMKHEIPLLLKQGGGVIVNTSSGAGVKGIAGQAAYCAAKFGIVGLTKAAALDYASQKIRINAVCPGIIETPMMGRFSGGTPEGRKRVIAQEPIGRMGKAEEIAAAVVWLCSDSAAFVIGHAMVIDGGQTV